MSSRLLQRCGEALYGPRWQSDLARDLGVSDRTVRRWAAGMPIPDGVIAELITLCRNRTAAIHDIIKSMGEKHESANQR